jgi:hypothetical protein
MIAATGLSSLLGAFRAGVEALLKAPDAKIADA